MTDWGYYEAARRFQRVLVASGIDTALRARGVQVRVGQGGSRWWRLLVWVGCRRLGQGACSLL